MARKTKAQIAAEQAAAAEKAAAQTAAADWSAAFSAAAEKAAEQAAAAEKAAAQTAAEEAAWKARQAQNLDYLRSKNDARLEVLRGAQPKPQAAPTSGFSRAMQAAQTIGGEAKNTVSKGFDAAKALGEKAKEFIPAAGQRAGMVGKVAGGLGGLLVAGDELGKVKAVWDDKDSSMLDVVHQAARSGLRTAGTLGGGALGAAFGTGLAGPVGTIGGGIIGASIGNKAVDLIPGKEAYDVLQENKQREASDAKFQAEMENVRKEKAARKQEALAAKAQQNQQNQQAQIQSHPLMAVFEQALKNIQPHQPRFAVPQQDFSRNPFAPMQNIGEMVANHADRVSRNRSATETLQMLPTIVSVYGHDQTAASARAGLAAQQQQHAFDMLSKQKPFYSAGKDGKWEENGPANSAFQRDASGKLLQMIGQGVHPNAAVAALTSGAAIPDEQNRINFNANVNPKYQVSNGPLQPVVGSQRASFDMADIPRAGFGNYLASKMPTNTGGVVDIATANGRMPVMVQDVTGGDGEQRTRLLRPLQQGQQGRY